MSTYYEYRDVKVMIAHKLMGMDGWTVYGYSPDKSDIMTDYYDPAYWSGVAEKNGYVLCVGVYGASEGRDITEYKNSNFSENQKLRSKIEKISRKTVERGATEAEAKSAAEFVEKLQEKLNENGNAEIIVTGRTPAHMAHPPKMNWHIEKDGAIVAKGNGILKFASIDQYFKYSQYEKDIENFRKFDKQEYINNYAKHLINRNHYYGENDMDKALQNAESHYKTLQEDAKLIDKFNELINKFDITCGSLVGNGTIEQYEIVKVTEYKKENKAFEVAEGRIKEGQCFILKSNFNYNRYKGLVYRIHESEYNGKKSYHAYKLNGKLTKECIGQASANNRWSYIQDEKFLKWIETGAIAWCEIKEVKTPYEVEKVIKKKLSNENKPAKKSTNNNTENESCNNNSDCNKYTYEISEDTDTRDDSLIYLVKVVESLSKDEFLEVNKYIKSLGGYYSRFKKAFLFKENPTGLFENQYQKEQEETESQQEEKVEVNIKYVITEDIHTKTNKPIWLVKLETEIDKQEFSKIKQKLATLKGYYSSFKGGFIFNYNPTEILESA